MYPMRAATRTPALRPPTLRTAHLHRQRHLELRDRLVAELFRNARGDVHRRLLTFARFDGPPHERLNGLAVFTRKMHIILGALQKLRADGFENEGEFHLHRRHEMKADQPARNVGADAERAEVHRLEMILRPPVQRDAHLATALVHFQHRRLREVEEEHVAKRPEADAGGRLPVAAHRFAFSESTFRFAYPPVARSHTASGSKRA